MLRTRGALLLPHKLLFYLTTNPRTCQGDFRGCVDNFICIGYNMPNFIGQFATILSVNKTMDFAVGMGAVCAHFLF